MGSRRSRSAARQLYRLAGAQRLVAPAWLAVLHEVQRDACYMLA